MQRICLAIAFCGFLTACVHNHISSGPTSKANSDRPLHSMLVFVEARDADFGLRIQGAVAEELNAAVSKVELGNNLLPPDADVNAVLGKARALGAEGALIVSIESSGVNVNKNPMPMFLNGAQYKSKSTSQLTGRTSARLFDLRESGSDTKIWQARAESNAGTLFGSRTPGDVCEDAVRDMVSDLRGDDLIAKAQ